MGLQSKWVNSFSTAVPFGGQTILIPSDLSPKRDWGPKRVLESKSDGEKNNYIKRVQDFPT